MSLLASVGWAQIVGRSPLRHVAFLAGYAVLMLTLAYLFHLRGLFTEVGRAAEQSQRLRIEQADKEGRAQVLASNQAHLAAAYTGLDQARWRLAAGGELAGLVEDIADQSRFHGVFVEQVELLPLVRHDLHDEQPMQLQVRGTYAALAGFALALAQLPRLLAVEDFTLLPAELQHPPGLRMQGKVSAYRSRVTSSGADSSSAEAGPARRLPQFSRSPFEPLPSMPPRQYLQTLAFDQFEMTGSLARRNVRFALLHAAGVVHRLQVGDVIGRDNGRVVRIEEQQIEVAEQVFVTGKGWVERRRTLNLKLPDAAR